MVAAPAVRRGRLPARTDIEVVDKPCVDTHDADAPALAHRRDHLIEHVSCVSLKLQGLLRAAITTKEHSTAEQGGA